MDIDARASNAASYNVRLLREIAPRCRDPYQPPGESTDRRRSAKGRAKWDDTCAMGGVGLGSMVRAPASSTTWKRRVTSY